MIRLESLIKEIEDWKESEELWWVSSSLKLLRDSHESHLFETSVSYITINMTLITHKVISILYGSVILKTTMWTYLWKDTYYQAPSYSL